MAGCKTPGDGTPGVLSSMVVIMASDILMSLADIETRRSEEDVEEMITAPCSWMSQEAANI